MLTTLDSYLKIQLEIESVIVRKTAGDVVHLQQVLMS